jgi:predicted MFS family arabinose efflux permease
MILTAGGLLFAGWGMASQPYVLCGMLFITFGELMIGSVAQYTLMRMTPAGGSAGFHYSLGITLMQSGRILGAAAAFPLLIHAERLATFTTVVTGVLALQLAVLWSLRGEVGRLN